MSNFNAEFCGFFWGEGCADIQRFKRGDNVLFRPRIRIHQRADEVDNLYFIQKELGGAIHYSVKPGGKSHPAYQWQLTNRVALLLACDILLSGGFPSKKVEQVSIVKRAVLVAGKKGSHFSTETKDTLEKYYLSLQELKRFSL